MGGAVEQGLHEGADTEGRRARRRPEEAAPEHRAVKNYITPTGLQRLRDELKFLLPASGRR
jgi:hypothetical protein